MKIGQFIKKLNTTKDTIRHYESMFLLNPVKINYHKEYSEKDMVNFEIIKELKEYGLALKDIQLIFEIKNAHECGNKQMVEKIVQTLNHHLEQLKIEEEEIHTRRMMLEKELTDIREYLI